MVGVKMRHPEPLPPLPVQHPRQFSKHRIVAAAAVATDPAIPRGPTPAAAS